MNINVQGVEIRLQYLEKYHHKTVISKFLILWPYSCNSQNHKEVQFYILIKHQCKSLTFEKGKEEGEERDEEVE